MSSKKEKFTDLINKNHKTKELKDEFDEYGRLIPREYKRNLDHNQLNMSKKFVSGHYTGEVGKSEFIHHGINGTKLDKDNIMYVDSSIMNCYHEEIPKNQITSISTSDGRQFNVGDVIENLPQGWEYNKEMQTITVPNTQWTDQWGRITGNPFTTDIQYPDTKIDNIREEWNAYKKIIEDNITIKKSNKVDKELVDSRLPYDIKLDFRGDIYYSFACAGYSSDQIEIKRNENGFLITFNATEDSSEFMDEEYEFLCEGIKRGLETATVFIDSGKYDLSKITTSLDYGVLTLKISAILDINYSIKDNNSKESVDII